MWLEWLSHTLSAPTRLPPAERGPRSRAEGLLAIDGQGLAREAAPGDAGAASLVSRPVVLEPAEPPCS